MKATAKLITLILLMAVILTACGGTAKEQKIVSYRLATNLIDGKMVFVGVGGDIDGMINPTLKASVGDTVEIALSSGEGAEHDIAFPDFNAVSEHVSGKDKTVALSFNVDKGGSFVYFCDLPGHRQAGMEGKFEVSGSGADSSTTASNNSNDRASMSGMSMPAADTSSVVNNAPTSGADIVREPTDLPAPIGNRAPTTVRIELEALEVVGQLADGATFKYWTFNGKVPGPFFRVRVGDTVEVHFKNSMDSMMSHSVDFHAVTGPGGGAVFTNVPPGQEVTFTFKALIPGLFVYHCATPMVAEHIANGMYGMILVEPEGGLSKVDREFYVMQGEIYTHEKFGSTGLLTEDVDKLLDEKPEYFVLNGAVGALTAAHPLTANVGETVRIFYGVGGPNFISSFHVIGEMFDRVYDQASLTAPPLTDVQTTLVPPGGATVVEFQLQVPGRYILVDHALSRLQRGLAGFLIVEGPDNPEVINGTVVPGSGH
jgi:nitrite reductase (NO-forming)